MKKNMFIIIILAASLMGCSTKTQKLQADTANTPKTITKIVYKDRIVYPKDYKNMLKELQKYHTQDDGRLEGYKESSIDQKIIFQTRMFLELRLENNTSSNDVSTSFFSFGLDPKRSFEYTQLKALYSSHNAILYDITLYNKKYPNSQKISN